MIDPCTAQTIQDELAIAHRAVREGDLGHAAFHIAAALVMDAQSAEAMAVFDAWFDACDNALGLVTGRSDPQWEGWFAMQALTHLKLGRADDGLPILALLAEAAPDKRYLSWLSRLKNPGEVSDEAADRAASSLLLLASSLPEPLPTQHPAGFTVVQSLSLLGDWRETKRRLAVPLQAIAIFQRKLGRIEAALSAARSLYELRPDWRSVGTLCSTLRAAGDLQGALDIARRGTELTPADSRAAMWLDVGDLCLQLDRLPDAREAYEAALALEPDNSWARSSVSYVRFRELGDEADRAALRDWSLAHPDDQRALQLLSAIGEPLLERPFVPSDATVGVFRHLQQSFLEAPPKSDPLELNLALSAPEGPSNLLALALLEQAFGVRLLLSLSIGAVPAPDPRDPLPGAEIALWRRAGDGFEPALAPPDESVRREVAVIAASPYRLVAWAQRSRILGEALGPARVSELVATLVHPPPLPHVRYDPPTWVQNVQVAAALAIAHVDQGWHGSARRATLLSLSRGPVDWSVTAAIVALMWVARSEPRSVGEIGALFAELRRRETRSASYTYEVPLRQAWLLIPGVDADTRALLTRELEAFSRPREEPAATRTDTREPTTVKDTGWRRPAAWAIALGSLLSSKLWPPALGDWWVLVAIAGLGLAMWVWMSGVEPLKRGA